jgi:RNA polymerase sigma-70 factor (ECF subfamily)
VAAARHGGFGRCQCKAAIQSVHAQRAVTGRVDHGALIGRAVVLVEAVCPAAPLDALDALPSERIASYQPFWVAKARALEALDRHSEAADARRMAVGLAADPAVRSYPEGEAAMRGTRSAHRRRGRRLHIARWTA